MSGRSGSAVAAHTKLVKRGENHYRVSDAQYKLIARLIASGGALHVYGAEVRSAQSLARLSVVELRDDGSFGKPGTNKDGERWTLILAKGVSL